MLLQDVAPDDYPQSYLVTAPKFLGYDTNNPVSIWYLYSEDSILSAVILEMNNLFGERRSYFMSGNTSANSRRLKGGMTGKTQGKRERTTLKASWDSEFHVSPFHSREGSCLLTAQDPLGDDARSFHSIDATISLSSSKGESELVTRLSSVGDAIDVSTMGTGQTLRFLSSRLWFGFAMLPRLVREAAVLLFKRQVQVWYRPGQLEETVERHSTPTEAVLEGVFRDYLRFIVQRSRVPLVVRYVPCGIPDRGEEIFASAATEVQGSDKREMRIVILRPVFYSRFVGYAHDMEAVFSELAESRTLWVDKPALLPDIFIKRPTTVLKTCRISDFLAFKMIQVLRRRPRAIRRPMTPANESSPSPNAVDIRHFRISSMDAFVLGHAPNLSKEKYRAAVIRLFLADRLALGHLGALGTVEWLCRLAMDWAVASVLTGVAETLRLML